MQICRRFLHPNLRCLAQQHRPGIQTRLHLHDAHAAFRVPRHDGAVNRRCPPPPRQERRVDVQAPKARRIQHRLRQDQPIGNHNRHIWLQCSKILLHANAAQRNGVPHQQTQGLCPHLNRAGPASFAAPGRTWGLAVNCNNFMPLMQSLKDRNGKRGGSHENDFHFTRPSFPARAISIFRFSGDR